MLSDLAPSCAKISALQVTACLVPTGDYNRTSWFPIFLRLVRVGCELTSQNLPTSAACKRLDRRRYALNAASCSGSSPVFSQMTLCVHPMSEVNGHIGH